MKKYFVRNMVLLRYLEYQQGRMLDFTQRAGRLEGGHAPNPPPCIRSSLYNEERIQGGGLGACPPSSLPAL